MRKPKRKLTRAEKAEKKRRRKEYMTIVVHGKQKRVRRPPTIDGMDVDEFIRQNADPIWLHQEEMWEYMEPIEAGPWEEGSEGEPVEPDGEREGENEARLEWDDDREIPF